MSLRLGPNSSCWRSTPWARSVWPHRQSPKASSTSEHEGTSWPSASSRAQAVRLASAMMVGLTLSCAGEPVEQPAARAGDMFAGDDAYERFMGRWSRQLAPLLIEFAEIKGPCNVLDVGCGTGALSAALGEQVEAVRVTGLDPSQAYVEWARRHLPSSRFQFDVGDAQQMAYADDFF